MAHIVFVHGLDNKPESGYLHQLWKRKLGHDSGPDLDANGVAGAMVYWADVFYPEPDTIAPVTPLASRSGPLSCPSFRFHNWWR